MQRYLGTVGLLNLELYQVRRLMLYLSLELIRMYRILWCWVKHRVRFPVYLRTPHLHCKSTTAPARDVGRTDSVLAWVHVSL